MTDFTTLDSFQPDSGSSVPFHPGSIPNAITDAPVDPTVPQMIETTGDLVTTFLNLNQGFAQNAVTTALATMDALSTASLPPDLPDPPAAPAIVTTFASSAALAFAAPPNLGSLVTEPVDPFDPDTVTVPDITSDLPTFVPLGLTITVPDAPTLVLPSFPDEPGLDMSFDIPTAPTKDYGASPDLLEIRIPAYVPPVIPLFNDSAPEFDVLPPEPFLQWQEPVYSSTVQDGVKAVLAEMLAGGTGLPEDVEQAIWERARNREDIGSLKTVDEAVSRWTVRGFTHPTGQLNAQTLAVDEENQRKSNELSRDVMIKQAELEQTNRNFAVEKGISYEQVFTSVFMQIVDRNFQITKFGVETQIQIYNMQVTAFNVEQQVYAQKITKYRVDLDAAFALLKGFEAQVNAEKAKAEVNTAMVAAFAAKVAAFNSQVEAYKAVVQAATAKAGLQRDKVDVFKAQIDAGVAKIGGERAKFEAYTARVGGETAKATLEEANARGYTAQVSGFAAKADIIIKQADVALSVNRQTLDWNIANMNRITANVGQQLSVVQSNLAAFQALTARGLAVFEADKQLAMSNLQAQVSLSQVAIAKYTALIEQWKVRAQEIIQFGTVSAESLRAAGQMASNLASGAMAGTHVSAGLSSAVNASQSSARSSSDSTSESKSLALSNSYSVAHSYAHKV
jgi:hypothetical protein